MKKFHYKRKGYRFFCLTSSVLILMLLSIIPVRLAIATKIAPLPQAILILGGSADREYFTAQFAQMHPSLEIWLSSGTPPDNARGIFRNAGITNTRLHIDTRAVDTVTNFTSLVKDFKKRHFQHLYIVTSDYHMARAEAIATFVLGSQGIAFTPVAIPTNQPTESWLHILRDSVRSLVWILTGRTGASLKSELQLNGTKLSAIAN